MHAQPLPRKLPSSKSISPDLEKSREQWRKVILEPVLEFAMYRAISIDFSINDENQLDLSADPLRSGLRNVDFPQGLAVGSPDLPRRGGPDP
jgi:hypothetical protein